MEFANLLFEETGEPFDKKFNTNSAHLQILTLLQSSRTNAQAIQSYIEQTDCNQMVDVNAPIEKYHQSEDYYQLFFRTYTKNQMFLVHLRVLIEEITKLKQQVDEADRLHKEHLEYVKLKNKKKNRRMAADINKDYPCPYQNCYKFYGSDVSLNLHVKIKHGGGNKSQRDKLAHEICMAEINGHALPKIEINLPPGYLDQYRNKFSGIKK